MAQVDVLIRGRPYPVGCAAGEEEAVGLLGRTVSQKVDMLVGQGLQASDAQLLLMVAIILAEEVENERKLGANVQHAPSAAINVQDEEKMEHLVERVKNIRSVIGQLASELGKL